MSVLDFILQDFQLFSAIVFFALLGLFLYIKRDKLDFQRALFPILYAFLYRTKLGLQTMDKISKKWPRFLKYFSYIGVVIGFIGMIFIIIALLITVYKIFFAEAEVGAAIIQPFVETSPGSMFFYVPFFYFIIAIFILAVVHECSHGIVARLFNIKLKSSGFAFLAVLVPIIPAAFVEPDEKEVKKLKPMKQLAIFAAGPFSNIILGIIIGLLLHHAIAPSVDNVLDKNIIEREVLIASFKNDSNTIYPAQKSGLKINDSIIRVDDTEITSGEDFLNVMSNTTPGQIITVQTQSSSHQVTLATSPDNKTGYLGVIVGEKRTYEPEFKEKWGWIIPYYAWFFGLFLYIWIFNLMIGLINLLPLGPVDGGRMVLTMLRQKFEEEKAKKIWGYISLFSLILLLANIFLPSLIKLSTFLSNLY